MHELFKQVLDMKDLSKAGDLFLLPDNLITPDLPEVLTRIRTITSNEDYLQNENDQSVVEICVARVTSCVGELNLINATSECLVNLLVSCLNYDLKHSPGTKYPPHAKIASDIMACLFLNNYTNRALMKLALPVAVKFLHKGNRELCRNVTCYLPLAAIENSDLLAKHVQPLVDSVIQGNYPLSRILPPIYTLNRERIQEHVMALANILPKCENNDKLAMLQLFTMVAGDNAMLLEPCLPQLLDGLKLYQTVQQTLLVFLAMSNSSKLVAEQMNKIKSSIEVNINCIGTVAEILRTLGVAFPDKSTEALSQLVSLLNIDINGSKEIESTIHAQVLREVLILCQSNASLVNENLIGKLRLLCSNTTHVTLLDKLSGVGPQIQTGNNAVTVIRVNDFSPFNTNVHCSSNNNIIYATNNNISTINSAALQSPSARLVRNRLNNSRGRLNGQSIHKSLTKLQVVRPLTLPQQQYYSKSTSGMSIPLSMSSNSALNTGNTSGTPGGGTSADSAVNIIHSHQPPHSLSSSLYYNHPLILANSSSIGNNATSTGHHGHGAGTGANMTIIHHSFPYSHSHNQQLPQTPTTPTSIHTPPSILNSIYHQHHNFHPQQQPTTRSFSHLTSLASAQTLCSTTHSNLSNKASKASLLKGLPPTTHHVAQSQPDLRLNTSNHPGGGHNNGPGGDVIVRGGGHHGHGHGHSNHATGSTPTSMMGMDSLNGGNRISVFEPYPMRDTVQHFCEKHLDKIKSYMEKLCVKVPLPVKCTIEERKSRKTAKLHFACQDRSTQHCLYSNSLFTMKTQYPRVWIHIMFLALQSRSSIALSTRETSVSSLKNCWDILKCESKSFLTLVTSAFPNTRDHENLIMELRMSGFFDVFSFNGSYKQWGCFLCNHPERALGILNETDPVIEGEMKEKKGKWRLFKRWRTRYFTLSGGQLSCRDRSSVLTTLDLTQIRSVRVSRSHRNIPKAFEIFTEEKTYVLKPKDSQKAEEWVQCLSVLVAHHNQSSNKDKASMFGSKTNTS